MHRPGQTIHLRIALGAVGIGLAALAGLMVPANAAPDPANMPAVSFNSSAGAATAVNPRWLDDDLPESDRTLLDANIGFAPPMFTEDLEWVGQARHWSDLAGRIVVVQSWTGETRDGRRMPRIAARVIDDFTEDEVLLISLHTPQGADEAKQIAEQRNIDGTIVVDPVGKFCDELGMYKAPTNVVIDQSGTVRYAGLNPRGLKEAIEHLLENPPAAGVAPQPRPADDVKPQVDVAFPTPTGDVRSARDIRGQKAPEFHVEKWITSTPDARDKVVIVDFWATWCGPCVASIPHMNELVNAFPDDVVAIGISDEAPGAFESGMSKLAQQKNITLASFDYALALDTTGRMKNAVQVRGIPHVLVLSSDWVVRYQGHPSGLNKNLLGQIVQANRGSSGVSRYRWSG